MTPARLAGCALMLCSAVIVILGLWALVGWAT
jgi:hypothetical protein